MRSTVFQYLNKLLCLLLCVVFLGLLCVGAWALPEERCQLFIDYQHESVSVSGAAFRLYHIADFDSREELSYVGIFSDLRMEAEALSKTAEDLYSRVKDRGMLPDRTVTTDRNGKASVSDLPSGAYLLVCEPTTVGSYIYYMDKQVVFLKEDNLTLKPKSTRLPASVQLISIEAVKRWDDRGYENMRPREITVRLLKDGRTVSTVVLSQANGWKHTWDKLLPNARWTVEEDVPLGYKVTVQKSGNVFTLTNQYKNIPQTGQIWWPVIMALCLGMVLIVLGMVIRRSGRNEA